MSIGDLTCECDCKEGVCIHLEALASQAPLTHQMRQHTAAALICEGSIQVLDATKALLGCPALANEVQQFTISVSEGICSCVDWQRNGLCCHLLAAIQLPQFVGFTLPMPEPDDQLAEISCSTIFVQPDMASATVDSLCQLHYPRLIRASENLAQSLKAKSDPQSAIIDYECRQFKRALSVMPAEIAAGLLQQLKDLRASAQAAAAPHALPTRHTQAKPGQIFIRKPTDRVVKPLEGSHRRRSAQTAATSSARRAVGAVRAASAARKVVAKAHQRLKARVGHSTGAKPAAYPHAQQKGRPRKHVSLKLSLCKLASWTQSLCRCLCNLGVGGTPQV